MDEKQNIVMVVMSGTGKGLVPLIINTGYNLVGYTDDYGNKEMPDYMYENSKGIRYKVPIKYLGPNNTLEKIREEYDCPNAVIGVGGVGSHIGSNKTSSPQLRRRLYQKVKKNGYELPPIIARDSNVSSYSVNIAEGALVMPGVIIQPGARVGKCSLINTGAQVDHDTVLEEFSHIAPGAIICGRVKVRSGAHIGAGAIVREEVEIGKDAVVGAGAVVVKDVPTNKVYVGNPAKELIRKR